MIIWGAYFHVASSTTACLPLRKGRKGEREGRLVKSTKMSLSDGIPVKATVFGIRQTWTEILLCHLTSYATLNGPL